MLFKPWPAALGGGGATDLPNFGMVDKMNHTISFIKLTNWCLDSKTNKFGIQTKPTS